MSQELLQIIEQVRREKNIEKEVLIEAIETAVLTTSKKNYENNENIEARLNLDTGDIELYRRFNIVPIVENMDLEMSVEEAKEIDSDAVENVLVLLGNATFGRIAAQAAKQVIYQKIRDAERENLYNEFKEREGEVVNGSVMRFVRKDIIVDLGKTEAILPYAEQSPRERYDKNDRIRVYIQSVQKNAKGLQIVVSRKTTEIVRKLFELEVPEIAENIVEIVGVVREAGGRSKIAVFTKEKNIDPVGTCVGIKGVRVQSVVQELCGEKVDIIKWTEDLSDFVGNALSPAQVISVSSGREGSMKVVVADDQLSFAIGKNGQNARLASRLTECRIDITSQRNLKQEQETALRKISEEQKRMVDYLCVSPGIADEFICAGWESVEMLGALSPDALSLQVPQITLEEAEEIIRKASGNAEAPENVEEAAVEETCVAPEEAPAGDDEQVDNEEDQAPLT